MIKQTTLDTGVDPNESGAISRRELVERLAEAETFIHQTDITAGCERITQLREELMAGTDLEVETIFDRLHVHAGEPHDCDERYCPMNSDRHGGE